MHAHGNVVSLHDGINELSVEHSILVRPQAVFALNFPLRDDFLVLILLIDQLLLPLNVFEHVLAFGEADVVGEDLRVGVVELAQFGHAGLRLGLRVGALEELVDVVQDQVVLEDGDHVGVLVVDQVVYYLDVVVVVVCRVLLRQSFLDLHLKLIVRTLCTSSA